MSKALRKQGAEVLSEKKYPLSVNGLRNGPRVHRIFTLESAGIFTDYSEIQPQWMNVIGFVYHVAGNNYRSYGLSIITLGRLLNTALGIGHVDFGLRLHCAVRLLRFSAVFIMGLLALDGFSLSCSFFPGLFFRISLGLFDLCEPFSAVPKSSGSSSPLKWTPDISRSRISRQTH